MIKAFKEFYDISVSLDEEAADWPGNPPYSRELISRKEDGGTMDRIEAGDADSRRHPC